MQQLQTSLLNLQSKRVNLQKLEMNRKALSKQSALITEAEALGSAISSHPLNTLTQRYNVYKRTWNEYNNCKQALVDQATGRNKQMADYRNCVAAVCDNKLTEYQSEMTEVLTALQVQPPTHEFDALKEFLENSAQMAIYIQSCLMSTELHAMMLQQIHVVQQSLATLRDYGNVARFQSQSVQMAHRIAKYADWCRFLCEHKTVQDCRDVAAQFHLSVGSQAITKIPLQQVVAFSYQLQTNIGEGQLKLQKSLERYAAQLEGTAAGTDMAIALQYFEKLHKETKREIRNLVHKRPNDLHVVTMNVLLDWNNRIVKMENAAASSGDKLVNLTFNGNWFLNEICTCVSVIEEIVALTEIHSTDMYYDGQNSMKIRSAYSGRKEYEAMKSIQDIYGQLRDMNEMFSSKILIDAMHGIIGEDPSVMEMVAKVSKMADDCQPLDNLLANLHLQLKMKTRDCVAADVATQIRADVKNLWGKLNDFSSECFGKAERNAGESLFYDIYRMFENLSQDWRAMAYDLEDLAHADWMRNVKEIKDAYELAVSYELKMKKFPIF